MVDRHSSGKNGPLPLFPDPLKDSVKLSVAHLEGMVLPIEGGARVEVQHQRLVHPNGSEVRGRPLVGQAKDARKEPCRRFVVVRRNNGVIENDGHVCLPLLHSTAMAGVTLHGGHSAPPGRTSGLQPDGAHSVLRGEMTEQSLAPLTRTKPF
jgi:hypothetical protein